MSEPYAAAGYVIFTYCKLSPRGLLYANFSGRRYDEVRYGPGPMGQEFSGNCDVASRDALLHNGATNATWTGRFDPKTVPPWGSWALAAEIGGTLATPNFREYLFRNCLENSWKASRGCVVVARRGRRVVYLPLLAALQAPLRDSFRISKQFRKVNSQKFELPFYRVFGSLHSLARTFVEVEDMLSASCSALPDAEGCADRGLKPK
jgi:hypothetical protein